MKRKIPFAVVLAFLLVPHLVWAGCSLRDVCNDVMDTLVIVVGGDSGNTITWESNSEPADLAYYKVVRSEAPGEVPWTHVATVSPDFECGATAATYEVLEYPPEGVWSYGIQVYSTEGLICTIVKQP